MGDSNRWLSASLLSSHGIWIAWLRIRIGQPQFPYWNLDSNLFMRDSNHFFQFELSRMWVRIIIWGIRIAFFSLNFLECGFESLYEGFESPSSVWTFWNVDSNRYMRDSNRYMRDSNRYMRDSNRLLRICLKSSRIEELVEGFESPCQGFESDHLKIDLSVHLWRYF